MGHKYSLKGALACKDKPCLEEWIHGFLLNEGNNEGLSIGLKKEKRIFNGPVNMLVEHLTRVCGPEEGMLYYEPKVNFDYRVEKLIDLYKDGWDMPPLRRMGLKEVPCIVWKTSKD